MKYEILFIQGGGSETPALEEPMVNQLHKALGADFHIRHPLMPRAGNPGYADWKDCIESEIAAAHDPLILLGHSLGGSVLLKYFSEVPVPEDVTGMILFGTPFWGAEGWKLTEFEIEKDKLERLAGLAHIYLYHSEDDEDIPCAHLQLYREVLPHATFRVFPGVDHSYSAVVQDMAKDIRAIIETS